MTEGRHEKSADAFRTISEVSIDLDVPQHVLRFWETKFTQVKPMKRAGGRRYYRPEDLKLLERIRDLLYAEGYTIRGVQKLLKEKGIKTILLTAADHKDLHLEPPEGGDNSTDGSKKSDIDDPERQIAVEYEKPQRDLLSETANQNNNTTRASSVSAVALKEVLEELQSIRALFTQES